MKIFVRNTAHGLVPLYDEDYEEKRKLQIGKDYLAEIKVPRNLKFHRLYFSLINCAWDLQSEERRQKMFRGSIDNFRKTVQIAAGHCETVYNLRLKDFVEIPKSISFESMDEAEFKDLYERVRDVLFRVFLKGIITEELFEDLLINY